MSDLISRQAAIDAIIEELQMPIMNSIFLEEHYVFRGMSEALRAIKELPSVDVHMLNEDDLQELEDRFGAFVRFVVEDMLSGKGERWENT